MAYKIDEIEGIGEGYAAKLMDAGIRTTDDLLSKAGARKGRAELAEATGISEKHILRWVNHADLMRIKGIGAQYAELLEAAGVDTVKELRHRNAANLTAAMEAKNEEKKLARTTPAESMVSRWIEAAKEMEPAVSH